MKEQIEEMIERVRKVTDDCQNCNLYKERLCDYNCDVCEAIQLACEALYNAGYRKQKEGEWITSDIPQEKYVCSVCGGACWYYDYQGDVAKSRYCPNCGAHMKGGAE